MWKRETNNKNQFSYQLEVYKPIQLGRRVEQYK